VSVRIMVGDCRESLAQLEAKSVQCCVTSPPYFGLRDYGHPGQLGLESTPQEYVEGMVGVFREVRRVLKDDGTLWLNIGDSYNGSGAKSVQINSPKQMTSRGATSQRGTMVEGCKAKDLIGMPWTLAFALRADGWYLRSEIIWHKPNPMPESVTDRPTKSHEQLFLLSKSSTYFYDAEAIKEPSADIMGTAKQYATFELLRNARTVWTIATQPYSGAHFATYPPALIEPCIKAGSAKDDTVLDPFGGAGTTGLVADRLGRNAILCELNPEYAELARKRITSDNPLFVDVA
jgi:DNA modification methylase